MSSVIRIALFYKVTINIESKPGLENWKSIGSIVSIGGVVYYQSFATSKLRHGIAIGGSKGKLNLGASS